MFTLTQIHLTTCRHWFLLHSVVRTPTDDVAVIFYTTVVSYMVLPLSRKWSLLIGGFAVLVHLIMAPLLSRAQTEYMGQQVKIFFMLVSFS